MHKNYLKTLVLVFSFLTFLSGCASVVRLPSSTGQIPETSGDLLKGRIGVDLSESIAVTTINDITTSPATRNEIIVGSDSNIIGEVMGIDLLGGSVLDLNLGLMKRLDVYYTNAIGVRFMVLGDPWQQGWRATLFGGYYSSDQSSSTTASSNQYTANTELKGFEFGTSFGNRVTDNSLFYLTLASRGGTADTEIQVNNTTTENYEDEFDHYISSLGFMYGQSIYFKMELSANLISWTGEDSAGTPLEDEEIEYGYTLGLGYHW